MAEIQVYNNTIMHFRFNAIVYRLFWGLVVPIIHQL